jgi:hypothetical protein
MLWQLLFDALPLAKTVVEEGQQVVFYTVPKEVAKS